VTLHCYNYKTNDFTQHNLKNVGTILRIMIMRKDKKMNVLVNILSLCLSTRNHETHDDLQPITKFHKNFKPNISPKEEGDRVNSLKNYIHRNHTKA
jgi:hypothetical protein